MEDRTQRITACTTTCSNNGLNINAIRIIQSWVFASLQFAREPHLMTAWNSNYQSVNRNLMTKLTTNKSNIMNSTVQLAASEVA
jgi:hypothetical protein